MKPAPVLSLIVGTRNRQTSFQRLLSSIERLTVVEWEIVVANASDGPLGILTRPQTEKRMHVINEWPPKGFAAGYNVACREAIGKWTLILNDDCEVLVGYDTAAIAFMEAHAEIGLGALPYSNKGGPFKTNANAFDALPYGNFPILSTELGNQIGWHDDQCVKMYGADNSLGFRVLLAGLGIAEIPEARILHHEHDDVHRQENLKGQQEDADRLKAKYGPLLPQMRETYERCRLVTA